MSEKMEMSDHKQQGQQENTSEEKVLAHWLPELQKTVWYTKKILSNSENKAIGRQLITALQNTMAGGELNDKLRGVLEHISKTGIYGGLTPAETAMYVFSLRPHLLAICIHQTEMQMQVLLDKAGLYTFEVYSKSRDTIIHQQRQQSNSQLRRLREKERALQQADRLATIGRLVAGVAHEINNPLAYIKMNTELVSLMLNRHFTQNSLPNTTGVQYKRPVEAILRGVERIATIVSGLKSFSRQEQKEKIGVDLAKCLKETWALVSSNKELASAVEMKVMMEPGLMIYCNGQQLEQVLINLIHNGMKAVQKGMPKQGRISVSAWREGKQIEWVVITVDDNGCGIPQSAISKIFEPFYTSDEENGTGLGLSIVQGIVHEHGGEITVMSVLGQGTTFTIRLPEWRLQEGDK